MKKLQVTAKQVADYAGVSRSSVSRVLSKTGYVSKETRTKVLKAVEHLGYRVNVIARGLNKQRTDLVGIIVFSLENPFLSRQIEYLCSALLAENLKPVLLISAHHSSQHLMQTLMDYNVSAVIVASDAPPEDIYQHCFERHIPVVLINKNTSSKKVDRILCDNEAGIAAIIEHLQKQKPEKICFIGSKMPSFSLIEREKFFRQYTKGASFEVCILQSKDHTYASGFETFLLVKDQHFDAIVCGNDLLGIGLIDAYKMQGLRPPLICGFDNITQANWSSYALTTVDQNPQLMAKESVQLILRRLAKYDIENKTIIIPSRLIIRDVL